MSITGGVNDENSIRIWVVSDHLPVPSSPSDHVHGPLLEVELGGEESGVLPAFLCGSHHSLLRLVHLNLYHYHLSRIQTVIFNLNIMEISIKETPITENKKPQLNKTQVNNINMNMF